MKDIFRRWCSIPEKLLELHNDLPFLPKRMKIKNVEKVATEYQN